jgi:hypothetical protein
MNRTIAGGMLAMLLISPGGASALAGHKAAYAGGTIARFNVSGTPVEGCVEVGPRELIFVADPGPHAGEPLRIDYASVRHLEFGQKVSRRKPLVVAATVALGPRRSHLPRREKPRALPHGDIRQRPGWRRCRGHRAGETRRRPRADGD